MKDFGFIVLLEIIEHPASDFDIKFCIFNFSLCEGSQSHIYS